MDAQVNKDFFASFPGFAAVKVVMLLGSYWRDGPAFALTRKNSGKNGFDTPVGAGLFALTIKQYARELDRSDLVGTRLWINVNYDLAPYRSQLIHGTSFSFFTWKEDKLVITRDLMPTRNPYP